MFDRILQIIDKCSNEKFPKQLVDDALMVYFEKGRTASEQFLVATKNLSSPQATELVSSIEKENQRLNIQALLINSIFFVLMLILLFFALMGYGYFFIAVYGSGAILWGMAWKRAFARYIKGRRK